MGLLLLADPDDSNNPSIDEATTATVVEVLAQEGLIAHVRELCRADPALAAALMYGSFAQGVADEYSDVEFWLFCRDDVDGRAWCERLGPTLAVTVNEFGAHVVFFPGLIRGEFHFAPAADMSQVAAWPSDGAPIDDMIVLDRDGELRSLLARRKPPHVPATAAEIEQLCLRFVNWLVLGLHVLARGEILRAHDARSHVHRHLLWMARLDADRASGATRTWLTPSRRAERELPPEVVARLHAAHDADPAAGLGKAWEIGREMWHALAVLHGFRVSSALCTAIDDRIVQLIADHHPDIAISNSKSEAPGGD